MNQYEAAYGDLKPEQINTPESQAEQDLAPIDDRHFFPLMTKSKTVYEVIYGPGDEDSFQTEDWSTAKQFAKAQAKIFGESITIQVTEDKEYIIG